jgi:hypothetical protein
VLAAGFLVAGCGSSSSTKLHKFGSDLNFSSKSASDAGVFGVNPTQASAIGRTADQTTYVSIKDKSGALSMEVPQEWKDVNPNALGPFSAALAASPDFGKYSSGWDVPGVAVGVSTTLGKQVASAALPELELPTAFASLSPRDALRQDCDPDVKTWLIGAGGSEGYFNQTLGKLLDFGLLDAYSNCGGNGAAFIDFAGLSKDRAQLVYGQFTVVSDGDVDPVRHILATLNVDSNSTPAPGSDITGPDFVLP